MGEIITDVRKKKSSFAKDVLTLGVGTTFAQAITVLIAPILTRLYDPDSFGILALFVSISGLITVISCLRYEQSIMLPETDDESANLLAVSLSMALAVSLSTIPVIIFLGPGILGLVNAPGLEPFLYMIPVAVFFGGVFLALNYWNSRSRKFKRLSLARVGNSIVTSAVQLGTGFTGYASGGSLIGANVLGSIVSTVVLGIHIWTEDKKVFLDNINLRGMISGVKRYRKFPFYSSWSAVLNNFSLQVPTLLLAAYFSPEIVGYYALGHRVLRLPMSLIGGSIAQVFFQRAAEAKSDGTLPGLVTETLSRLLMLGMFPILLLMIVGRDLFIVVFGEGWAEAGVYMQILGLWTFLVFIGSPIGTLANVLEKQEVTLLFNVILFISRILSLVVGGIYGSPRLALFLFAASGVIVWVIYILWLIKVGEVSLYTLFTKVSKIIFLSASLLSVILVAKLKFHVQPVMLLMLSVIVTVFYYLFVLYIDKTFFVYLLRLVKKQ